MNFSFMHNKKEYREVLEGSLSRAAIDLVITSADNDPEAFSFLAEFVLKGKDPLPMRASWALDGIDLKYPELIKPFIKPLIFSLYNFKHPGTQRNILKILSRKKIPVGLHGKLVNFCFEKLYQKDTPVAVKVHAMQNIANLSENYPELMQELSEVLNDLYDSSSPGFQSSARKILKNSRK